MIRYPACTPGEFERSMTFLDPVDPDRRPAIARMVFSEVGMCPTCDRTVRRYDRRAVTTAGLAHLSCTVTNVTHPLLKPRAAE